MTIYENLDIVDVLEDNQKITFIILDNDKNEIHDVIWRKQSYNADKQEYVDDDNKLQQVKDWCKQYFDLELKDIKKAIGRKVTVYGYDTYDSLWESDAKFDKKDKGKMIQTKVKSVELTNNYIKIRYDWNGKTYASYKRFTEKYGDNMYVNPLKRRKQLQWFEDTFGVPVDQRDKAVGRNIIVEVKSAFGTTLYGDVKPGME